MSLASKLPHTLEDILATAEPDDPREYHGIYFLILKGVCVYVGQSVAIQSRLRDHRARGVNFTHVSMIFCDAEDMDRLESLYIRAFKPALNRNSGKSYYPPPVFSAEGVPIVSGPRRPARWSTP